LKYCCASVACYQIIHSITSVSVIYVFFGQRDARGIDKVHSSKKVNPYDVQDMVMPLHQYINDPIAHEIIHNGATFQV
jgi:hypothetical protein